MKRKWLCTAVAVTVFAASIYFPNFSAAAKDQDNRPIIIYELGDPRVPDASKSNGVIHDLNKNETDTESLDDISKKSIIIYELGDPRVPDPSKSNGIIHDLNKNEMDTESLDDISKKPIIIYELGDPRVPDASESNGVIHDLNKNETDTESLDDISKRSIIIYELGDTKVPVIDWSNTEYLNFLEEPIGAKDFAPSIYHNLEVGSCNYSFSNVHQYVFTNAYFSTNKDGYISVSINGINNSMRISMIEYGSDKVVGSWAGDPQTVSGISFPGDSTKFYYFKFESYDNITSITGICGIF